MARVTHRHVHAHCFVNDEEKKTKYVVLFVKRLTILYYSPTCSKMCIATTRVV